MPKNKILKASGAGAGFSLVELMVGITVGMIVTAAVIAILVSVLRLDKEVLASTRLNQELSTTMQIMSNELVRAGYTGPAGRIYGDLGDNGIDDAEKSDIRIVSSDCILFSYNRDKDTADIEDNERNGFKLEDGILKMRTTCPAGSADCDLCTTGTWESLTDSDVVTVNSLAYTSTGSKCRNVDTGDYWYLTATDATAFACVPASCTNNTSCTYNSATLCSDQDSNGVIDYATECAAGSTPTVLAGDHTVDVRQVNITMTGELTNDDSVSVSLNTSTKTINHMVRFQQE